MSGWLRLWFTLDAPVDRGTYLRHGAGLMLFKYGVDTAAVWLATGRAWTPLDYLSPLLASRARGQTPPWLLVLLALWTLPFIWIGVGMTLRRAVDAGRSPWWCLAFFVPVLNYAAMLWMAILPSTGAVAWEDARAAISDEGEMRSAVAGMALGLTAGVTLLVLNTRILHRYNASLFLATPFLIGALTAVLFNRPRPRPLSDTLLVATLALGIACGGLLLFAFEGIICIAMALPLMAVLVVLGAVVGRAIAIHVPPEAGRTAALVLLLPLGLGIDAVPRTLPVHEVATAVEVDASPAVVWQHVIRFPELTAPPGALFLLGVAYPRGARIEGSGVGAVRYCEFSTGAFVEPITAWDEPRRLAFDVRTQPPAMRELSPYPDLDPPHLRDAAFRAVRGEFRLVPLANGRTRLEGRTWYTLAMEPEGYWTIWTDALVGAIHRRVLAHVRALAERR